MDDHPRPHLRCPPAVRLDPRVETAPPDLSEAGVLFPIFQPVPDFLPGEILQAQLPKSLQRSHLAHLLTGVDLGPCIPMTLAEEGQETCR